jgi:hypothetical protein
MQEVIEKTYLPFKAEELRQHFMADVDKNLEYYQKSASLYREFLSEHLKTAGIPLTQARVPRQIEKDERFWTVTATKLVFDDPLRNSILEQLLAKAYGSTPPIPDCTSWGDCLNGDLHLYFEARLPSPLSYVGDPLTSGQSLLFEALLKFHNP